MPQQRILPLFPLNLVLFPDSRVALHIFEPRYKLMMQQCLMHSTDFGINLLEREYLHPVGCAAVVEKVARTLPDGSFDVVVLGTERYIIVDYKTHPAGYMEATIEAQPDIEETVPEELRAETASLYNMLVAMVFPGEKDLLILDEERIGRRISFAMAEKAGLDLVGRQRLLECPNEAGRLDLLLAHMRVLMPTLLDERILRNAAANDGYLPRSTVL